MQLPYFLLQILIFISLLAAGMEQNANAAGTNAPEHLPGSNMIGAGRGARIHKWKESQTTKTDASTDAQSTPATAQGAEKK